MKLLKQAIYIRYVLAKLSKFVQISTQTSPIPFYRGFFENKKRPGTSFQATTFIEFLDKKFSLAMLHRLALFHQQTMFTSQVIQQNMFRVSCLGI